MDVTREEQQLVSALIDGFIKDKLTTEPYTKPKREGRGRPIENLTKVMKKRLRRRAKKVSRFQ